MSESLAGRAPGPGAPRRTIRPKIALVGLALVGITSLVDGPPGSVFEGEERRRGRSFPIEFFSSFSDERLLDLIDERDPDTARSARTVLRAARERGVDALPALRRIAQRVCASPSRIPPSPWRAPFKIALPVLVVLLVWFGWGDRLERWKARWGS